MALAANDKRFSALLLHDRFPMRIAQFFQLADMVNFVHIRAFVAAQFANMSVNALLYRSPFGEFMSLRDNVADRA
ncbi:MAG: hypothetical protein LBK91_02820, partial [Synergistaceae bacterium]|nr:hypothetical protein [Synergistaceae bacterium]